MVDAATAAAASTTSGAKSSISGQKLADDMDHFMNLLVTQLKNQDPLEPMDPNEFTGQLVQFASVEQQIQGNKNLEDLLELQKDSQVGTLVGYIDKFVEANGNTMSLEDGVAQGSYTLADEAGSTLIILENADGDTVYSGAGETKAGRHEFAWDGLNKDGYPEPPGNYTMTVSSLDRDGNPVDVSQTATGTVTGISMDGNQTNMHIGDAEVSFDDILSVGRNARVTVN